MSPEDGQRAREWYRDHRAHVIEMLAKHGPQIEPTGSDARRPELWKDIHWRWFLLGDWPARPIGVNLKD